MTEFLINGMAWLAHIVQHPVRDVLGRDLELAGDVVQDQLLQKGGIGVGQQIVKTDAAADKDLFDARQGAELLQQGDIVPMLRDQIFARAGEQALPRRTGAGSRLFVAGGAAEICRRPADVVDVALEIGRFRHFPRFAQNGFVAAHLHDAALMEGQRAERAAAEAATVGNQTEAHLADGRHARPVGRMRQVPVRKIVDLVHFLRGKRLLRGILNDKFPRAVGLYEPLGAEGIGVLVLEEKALGIAPPVFLQFSVGRQPDRIHDAVRVGRAVDRSVDEGQIGGGKAAVQRVRRLDDAALSHAVEQQVGLRVEQNGALEPVGPVIVVRQPPQAGLNAADQDGNLRVRAADEVAVDHRGVVRAPAGHAAGRVGVGAASVPAHGIVIDHGVHVPAGDEEAETRRAENIDRIFVPPVGLGDDRDLIARVLQHPADNGVPEGGMIDIGVAYDVDEIRPFPAQRAHFLRADGQKAAAHFVPVEPKPPAPRTVSESISASTNCAVRKGVRIICAMRSPGSTVWGTGP